MWPGRTQPVCSVEFQNFWTRRVGRGPFPTFPAGSPFFRFPLDYVFHSDTFTLNSIQRLQNIGSDHLPMSVSLTLNPSVSRKPEAPEMKGEDLEEAHDTIERAHKDDN